MKKPEIKIINFGENDVIATSKVVIELNGLYNGNPDDATMTYKKNSYDFTSLAALNAALSGTGVTIDGTTKFYQNSTSMNKRSYSQLSTTTGSSSQYGDNTSSNATYCGYYNGLYEWDSVGGRFVHQ